MKIVDFEVIDHGVMFSDYFPGCGTTFTTYENVATGIGSSVFEAIDDCLDQIAQTVDVDFEQFMDSIIEKYGPIPTELTVEDPDEDETEVPWNYVSIRYNLSM